jgi:hypothetical protein
MDITWKTAILALMGLVAIATVGMKPSAASKGGVRSAAVDLAVCNIHDPFSPCFADNFGDPAGDLFIEYF